MRVEVPAPALLPVSGHRCCGPSPASVPNGQPESFPGWPRPSETEQRLQGWGGATGLHKAEDNGSAFQCPAPSHQWALDKH